MSEEQRYRHALPRRRDRSRPPLVVASSEGCAPHWRVELVTLDTYDLIHHGAMHVGYGEPQASITESSDAPRSLRRGVPLTRRSGAHRSNREPLSGP